MNLMFYDIKKLKKQVFDFYELKNTQKPWITPFCKIEKAQKTWI